MTFIEEIQCKMLGLFMEPMDNLLIQKIARIIDETASNYYVAIDSLTIQYLDPNTVNITLGSQGTTYNISMGPSQGEATC